MTKPLQGNHFEMIFEAPYPSKAACTSMWSTYKVFVLGFIQLWYVDGQTIS